MTSGSRGPRSTWERHTSRGGRPPKRGKNAWRTHERRRGAGLATAMNQRPCTSILSSTTAMAAATSRNHSWTAAAVTTTTAAAAASRMTS